MVLTQDPVADPKAASIDDAKQVGRKFLSSAKSSEKLGRNFAVKALIAIKLGGDEFRKEALLELPDEESSSSRIYFAEVSSLTGYSHVKAGAEGVDRVSKQNLTKQVSYAAELVEATEWLIKKGGKDGETRFKHKITGTGDDYDQIVAIRDAYTVQNMLRDYRKARTPTKTSKSNDKPFSRSETLESIAKDYGSASDPIGSFASTSSQMSAGDLGLAICRRDHSGQFHVHEALNVPDEMTLEVLRHSSELPTAGIEDQVDFVAEVLHVASKACPDPSEQADNVQTLKDKKKPNFRQFLFLPDDDEIVVGYSRVSALPSVRVKGLDDWPFKPNEHGMVRTSNRREFDEIANRVDRRKYSIGDAIRENGQKWVSKFYFVPHGGQTGKPLQIDPFLSHRLDVYVPDTTDTKWQAEVVLDRGQLLEFYRQHLSPYSRSKKSEKDAKIITFSFNEDSFAFKYKGIKEVAIESKVTTAPSKPISLASIGNDWTGVIEGLIALDMVDPITIKVDSTGVFELSTKSRHAAYAFYIAGVMPGEISRSDRYFKSARRIIEQKEAAKDAEDLANAA